VKIKDKLVKANTQIIQYLHVSERFKYMHTYHDGLFNFTSVERTKHWNYWTVY